MLLIWLWSLFECCVLDCEVCFALLEFVSFVVCLIRFGCLFGFGLLLLVWVYLYYLFISVWVCVVVMGLGCLIWLGFVFSEFCVLDWLCLFWVWIWFGFCFNLLFGVIVLVFCLLFTCCVVLDFCCLTVYEWFASGGNCWLCLFVGVWYWLLC